MKEEVIPYEQAVQLNELDYNEHCIMCYYHLSNEEKKDELFIRYNNNGTNTDNSLSVPLYQQAFRWFREKHNLYGIIIPTITMDWTFKTTTVVYGMVEVPPYSHVDAYDYSSYEEAELECLKKLIEIIKNK